jgi:hypothetical protein
MLAAPQLYPEGAICEQDMAPLFLSGMVIILAISEMMTSGNGTTSVPAITNRLLQVASSAAGFTDHVIRQLGACRLDRRDVALFFPALTLLCKQAGLATPPDICVIPGSYIGPYFPEVAMPRTAGQEGSGSAHQIRPSLARIRASAAEVCR